MCGNRFFLCKHCGNLVNMIHSSGVPMICCGSPMTELEAGSVDASQEKHVPVVTVDGDTVTVEVGSVVHPMTEEHHIAWIQLQTDTGAHRKCLEPGQEPKAVFHIKGEKPLEAYEYCNLHGLWKTVI